VAKTPVPDPGMPYNVYLVVKTTRPVISGPVLTALPRSGAPRLRPWPHT